MRRPSPALVISCLALFVALGGSALAAHHYLITSKSQISPKVLKALHGAQGPAGPAGPVGATGKAGAAGAPGKNGTDGTNGIDGKNGIDGSARAYATVTEAGAFSAVGKNIGSVERPDPGLYCVSFGGGIAPSNSIAIAMPIYGGHKVFMQADPGSVGECKIANAFVIEAHGAGGSLENTSFYVMVP